MIFEIVKFGKLLEFFKLKIQKFSKNSNLEKQNLVSKIDKFWNCSSIRYSALFEIRPILIFAL